MKKLKKIFKTKDEILNNVNIPYIQSENNINFKIENNEFKIILMENFHFIKETKDDVFEIKKDDSTVKAQYLLKDLNVIFDVKVIDFKYTFRDNIYNIKYNIESDPNSVKEIILTLDD